MRMPLLQTKLHMPPLRAELVRRSRLTDRLEDQPGRKLTLISAPAGFGKTTLAGCWLAQQAKPVAWVSLDENDNDPIRFFSYAITALHQTAPDIGRKALEMLQSSDTPSYNTLLAYLINDLAQSENTLTLVLDDYHLIDNGEIHTALTFLLDNLPSQLHLALISRAEPPLPIAKLRSKNQLVELHAPDLRFTWAEAETFLNQVMRLGLSGEQITQLESHTEGWITGLQLTALSIKDTTDAAKLIETIAGGNRFITDYLIDEVLFQQPDRVQQFLLQTAVLERLCADLCDAVVNIENSQAILETLEKSNLFVIPLDNNRNWFRYHHLFAEMLRFRLEHHHAELVPALYRRAFEWHQAQGLLEEAIRDALKGQMYAEAADIVENIGYRIYWRNLAHTVGGWLAALPDNLMEASPQLRILLTLVQIDQGKLQVAERTTDRLERYLEQHPRPTAAENLLFEGKLKAMQTAIVFHRHMDGVRGSQLARRALEILPDDCTFDRCVAAFHGGGFLILLGEQKEARRYLNEALVLSSSTDAPIDRLLVLSNFGFLELNGGALYRAYEHFQEVVQLAQEIRPRQGSTFSNALVGLGLLHYEWNQVGTALEYINEAIKVAERDEFLDRLLLGYSALIWGRCTQGQLKQARAARQRLDRLFRNYNAPGRLLQFLDLIKAQIALVEGNFKAAADWADEVAARIDGPITFTREQALRPLARVWMAQNRFDEAISLLTRLRETAVQQQRFGSVVRLETLLAKACYLKGDHPKALDHLRQALILAEPEGYVRSFLDEGEPTKMLLAQLSKDHRRRQGDDISIDYVQKLLDAFGAEEELTPLPARAEISPVKLTPRELEVLQHLAGGLAYADIAAQLVITENTLKYHIKNIYGKLNVNNRMQAVATARQLSLL